MVSLARNVDSTGPVIARAAMRLRSRPSKVGTKLDCIAALMFRASWKASTANRSTTDQIGFTSSHRHSECPTTSSTASGTTPTAATYPPHPGKT